LLSLVSLVLLTFSSILEILKVLTRDGKDIEYMEEAIGMTEVRHTALGFTRALISGQVLRCWLCGGY